MSEEYSIKAEGVDPWLARRGDRDLREEIHRVQAPFIQMLVDLYSVSLPTITIIDGKIAEYSYPPDVEKRAREIRGEMADVVRMTCRYRRERSSTEPSK